jgi:hypothetical protein
MLAQVTPPTLWLQGADDRWLDSSPPRFSPQPPDWTFLTGQAWATYHT